jgi:hypothetical protein
MSFTVTIFRKRIIAQWYWLEIFGIKFYHIRQEILKIGKEVRLCP